MNDNSKAERGDRKIVPAQTHGEKRKENSGDTSEPHSCNERDPERNSEFDDQQRRDIGTQTIESRVTEIQLAGVTEDKVESDSEQHIDGAYRQIRAPIGVIEDERQNGDDRYGERISQPPRAQQRMLAGQMLRKRRIRHFLRVFPK